ncbi:MAG: sulfurtransferase FdhD [Polynucleobacter sp. 32-46-5]|nr:MAG: sulfurtransferase FdhD [Polynucleobacter sp. 32-46-5]
MASSHNIEMSNASVPLVHEVQIMDEAGRLKTTHIPGERPLTIYLDKREVVTLMTLGSAPEALVLGYLRNQRLVESPDDIASIQVDWETDSAAVKTHRSTVDIDAPGSVHACAVFERQGESGIRLLHFIEDVGRHNAVDSISGLMWLADKEGKDLIFFTTGRLTSEMVIKGAQMGIPFLLTRSGVTLMGLELARKTNLTLLSRCSGKHFEIYNAPERVVFTSSASAA